MSIATDSFLLATDNFPPVSDASWVVSTYQEIAMPWVRPSRRRALKGILSRRLQALTGKQVGGVNRKAWLYLVRDL